LYLVGSGQLWVRRFVLASLGVAVEPAPLPLLAQALPVVGTGAALPVDADPGLFWLRDLCVDLC